MGLGGPFLFISFMQLSNAFPRNSGQVLSVLTGSFDASSCVFLLYRLMYYNVLKISPSTFFLAYLFFPILSISVQLWFMPKDSYKSEFEMHADAAEARQSQPTETTSLLSEDQAFIHFRASAVDAIESDILEAYGTARRASVFSMSEDQRASYDAAEHRPRFFNPVTGAMHRKTSIEQIRSPYWT